jgi:Uma2 family endonuclease
MKIQVDKAKHYVYPDVSIVCDTVEFSGERDDVVINPIVLFEILSAATKDYDRGSKFMAYRNVISLRDYILVDQYSFHVEHFQKNDNGQWVLDEYKSQSDAFIIKSLGVKLSLQNIYDRVKFEDHERRGMDETK